MEHVWCMQEPRHAEGGPLVNNTHRRGACRLLPPPQPCQRDRHYPHGVSGRKRVVKPGRQRTQTDT